MLRQLRRAFTLALVFAVAGQYLLLAADQLGYTHRLIRSIVVFHLFLGKMFFLFCDLSNGGAAVVQRADLPVECCKTVSDADDFQKRVGLFPVVIFMKRGRSSASCSTNSFSSCWPPLRPDGSDTVSALFFPRRSTTSPLERLDMQTGRRVGAFALRRLRAVFVSAQRPGDCVQNARFSLVVIAADNGQAVECGTI